jgi:hypothetical protein
MVIGLGGKRGTMKRSRQLIPRMPTLRRLTKSERELLELMWFGNWIWIQDWKRWEMIHNHVRSNGY